MKNCSVCKQDKPFSEYWVTRKGRTRDGYGSRCKECSKACVRTWNANNKERASEHSHRQYLKDPQRYSANAKRWNDNNLNRARELKRSSEQSRRAKKRNQFIETVDPAIVYEMHGGMCGICKEFVSQDNFHVDHVIPISKGGMHGYVNVQPAHPTCNIRKGNKI